MAPKNRYRCRTMATRCVTATFGCAVWRAMTSRNGNAGIQRGGLLTEFDFGLRFKLPVIPELDRVARAGSAAAEASQVFAFGRQQIGFLFNLHEDVFQNRFGFAQGEIARDSGGALLEAQHAAGFLVDPDRAL